MDVHVIIGLAGQTPITLYDEAYLGMDAVMRKLFINELLDDYIQRPKLIIFSTHFTTKWRKYSVIRLYSMRGVYLPMMIVTL